MVFLQVLPGGAVGRTCVFLCENCMYKRSEFFADWHGFFFFFFNTLKYIVGVPSFNAAMGEYLCIYGYVS